MGQLMLEIANRIHMFQPRTLKDAIGLSCVREEQVGWQNRLTRLGQTQIVQPVSSLPNQALRALAPTLAAPKRLSWEEMQCQRAQRLCFNCNELHSRSPVPQPATLLAWWQIDRRWRTQTQQTWNFAACSHWVDCRANHESHDHNSSAKSYRPHR